MARPRSEDKRNAILAAAVEAFAEAGLGAPTARIAKAAGVAEGTLFTYFTTKDELLNQLYLSLKTELRDATMPACPRNADLREKTRHFWLAYVAWGAAQPDKRRLLGLMKLSPSIKEATRNAGAEAFADLLDALREGIARGQLQPYSTDFVCAIMSALAETTMEFMCLEPKQAARHRDNGFAAFWQAIRKPEAKT